MIRGRVSDVDGFDQPLVQSALKMWADSYKCTTHQLEIDHAGNKRRNTALTKWEVMAARAVNSRACQIARSAFDDAQQVEP